MNRNRRRASSIFLLLGIVFLVIGISTNNTAFSWAAVAFILISLIAGGRWLRPRHRK